MRCRIYFKYSSLSIDIRNEAREREIYVTIYFRSNEISNDVILFKKKRKKKKEKKEKKEKTSRGKKWSRNSTMIDR